MLFRSVNNNLVPVYFVILDIECNLSCPIVLGRPFIRTVGAIIDIQAGHISRFPNPKPENPEPEPENPEPENPDCYFGKVISFPEII